MLLKYSQRVSGSLLSKATFAVSYRPDPYDTYIDLRSDTVTKPTKKMREAMKKCPVGDDHYKGDPTVNLLQEEIAKLFGKEASLFVATGTMGNLMCNMVHAREKGEACIVGDRAHVYTLQRGGIATIGGILPVVVPNQDDGTIKIEDLEKQLLPDWQLIPKLRLINLENTHNSCQGAVIKQDYVREVRNLCDKNNLKLHLDGARIFNAAVALKQTMAETVHEYDTICVCLSKGLGCPIGSMVVGSGEDMEKAIVARKLLGGAWRQAGVLAACALEALENWEERMQADYENAKTLAEKLHKISAIDVNHATVQSNIFRIKLKPDYKKLTLEQLVEVMRDEHHVLMSLSPKSDEIRIVTNSDVSKKDIAEVAKAFSKAL